MGIRFDEIDGLIISFDGTVKHLILFDYWLFNKICDKIKYLISNKSGITNSINYNFGRIRIDSYSSLPIKIIKLTFHNVIILIKLVANKNKYEYYYNIFFEKGSDKYKWMLVYYKCYIMIELTFLKELMLIEQLHHQSVVFVTIGFS